MRLRSWTCSRIRFTRKFIASTPSSADRPWSGAPAACAEIPRKRNFAERFASESPGLASFRSPGCHASTASTSEKNPSRTRYTLPAPPSSAGVPYTRMRPSLPLRSSQSFTANPAATEAVPKRWWPQACPAPTPSRSSARGAAVWLMPGRASNSARIPTTGPPEPHSATKAVGIPAIPASTSNPAAASCFCRRPELRSSW